MVGLVAERLVADHRGSTVARIRLRIMPSTRRRKPSRAGRYGKAPRRHQVSAEQFRDARIFAGFTRPQAAEFLGVSLRSVGHWETGTARCPYAAFKLLRIYRHGELVDPRWSGFRLSRGGHLVTPENHELAPSDLAWLSLLVRRSHALTDLLRARDRAPVQQGAVGAPVTSASESLRHTAAPTWGLPLSLAWQGGVASGCTDVGVLPRVEQGPIGQLYQFVRLPSSNRGVSGFRNGAGKESVGLFALLEPKADSHSLFVLAEQKPGIAAQAAPREALGLVALARSGGAL